MSNIATQPNKLEPKKIPVEWTTDAQAEEYLKLFGKKFVRIDPETKKPHESSKEFFWSVVHIYPAFYGHGNESEYRATCEVQKYYRNKTYTTKGSPDGNTSEAVKHEAFTGRNRHGDLIDTGTAQYDVATFIQQFVEDKDI